MAVLIDAGGLCKAFGTLQAVDGISLQVAAGEIYGLVGPDGAGKTTFLRLLCGVMRPDAGWVTLNGVDMAQHPEQAREQIGYLAQRFSLYEDLSVLENLQFFAEVRGLPAGDWQPRSREILQFVGLDEFQNRRAGQLSGGMKQKLGLALALVNRPSILLLDEPTTGVDPLTRQDFWRLIIRLLRDQRPAVLVSTPYMDEASRCARVGFIQKGRLTCEGPPRTLQARLAGRILSLSGSPLPLLAALARADRAVEAVERFGDRLHLRLRRGEDAQSAQQRLLEGLRAGGGQIEALQAAEPQLEDVFIDLLENADARPPQEDAR